jgi:hypothetical protein
MPSLECEGVSLQEYSELTTIRFEPCLRPPSPTLIWFSSSNHPNCLKFLEKMYLKLTTSQ